MAQAIARPDHVAARDLFQQTRAMKLEPRRWRRSCGSQGPCAWCCCTATMPGWCASAGRLVRAVAGSTDDPFRVVELGREALSDIAAEMASLPLTGGRRVVVVRDAGDAAAAFVQAALAGRGAGCWCWRRRVGPRSRSCGRWWSGGGWRGDRVLCAGGAGAGAGDPAIPFDARVGWTRMR